MVDDKITLEKIKGFELLLKNYNYKLKSPEFEVTNKIDLDFKQISENVYECAVLAILDGTRIETEFFPSFKVIYNLLGVFYEFALNNAEYHPWDETMIFE